MARYSESKAWKPTRRHTSAHGSLSTWPSTAPTPSRPTKSLVHWTMDTQCLTQCLSGNSGLSNKLRRWQHLHVDSQHNLHLNRTVLITTTAKRIRPWRDAAPVVSCCTLMHGNWRMASKGMPLRLWATRTAAHGGPVQQSHLATVCTL